MMLEFKKSFYLLYIIFFLISSCSTPSTSKKSNDDDNSTKIENIEWQLDSDNFYRFYTNDINKCAQTFIYNIDYNTSPMNTIIIRGKKVSGLTSIGYGFRFCYTDSNNYFGIYITVNGSYRITKVESGVFSIIQDWTSSNKINTGFNVENDIKIQFDGTDTYTYSFNNNVIGKFTNANIKAGDIQFYVYIQTSTIENFPTNPEDYRYKIISTI